MAFLLLYSVVYNSISFSSEVFGKLLVIKFGTPTLADFRLLFWEIRRDGMELRWCNESGLDTCKNTREFYQGSSPGVKKETWKLFYRKQNVIRACCVFPCFTI